MSPKQKIVAAIKSAKTKEFTLISGDWGESDMHCACALGCVLLSEDEDDLTNAKINCEKTAKILNVSEDWVDSFIDGFDGCGEPKWASVEAAWKLGKEIREQHNPIEFEEHLTSLEE